MKFMNWNCQGAASNEFLRVLRNFVQHYKLDMVALLEPRISGEWADKVCTQIGFANWIRVEVVGFSGVIWLLWRDKVQVTVLATRIHSLS